MTYDMIGPDEKRTVGVALTDAELAEMREATGAGTNSQAVVSAARLGTKWLRAVKNRLAVETENALAEQTEQTAPGKPTTTKEEAHA